jgi:hypothetical protein
LKRAVIAKAPRLPIKNIKEDRGCEYCRNHVQFAMQSFSIEYIKPRQAEDETVIEEA